MKDYIKKLLCFALPFALLLGLFAFFEPYDYWGLKGQSAYLARPLSSVRCLLRERPENIILGDSRMANLNTDYIAQNGGGDYLMLAFGGATLNEAIELFWYAAERTELKKVAIGVSFYSLNDNRLADRFGPIVEAGERPLAFLSDYAYWNAAGQEGVRRLRNLLCPLWGGEELVLDDPSSLMQETVVSDSYFDGWRLDLWEHMRQIESSCNGYRADGLYLERLGEIADYCDQNGIELTFIIPNSNRIIWQEVIYPLGIDKYIDYYKDFLKSRATVYDMEFDNPYAADDSLFGDTFHMMRLEKQHLARVFFCGERSDYCLVTTREQYLAQKEAAQ